MSGAIGYTAAEARRRKRKLNSEMETIEDAARRFQHIVPDTDEPVDAPLEELRAVVYRLEAAIDRRTQRRAGGQ